MAIDQIFVDTFLVKTKQYRHQWAQTHQTNRDLLATKADCCFAKNTLQRLQPTAITPVGDTLCPSFKRAGRTRTVDLQTVVMVKEHLPNISTPQTIDYCISIYEDQQHWFYALTIVITVCYNQGGLRVAAPAFNFGDHFQTSKPNAFII